MGCTVGQAPWGADPDCVPPEPAVTPWLLQGPGESPLFSQRLWQGGALEPGTDASRAGKWHGDPRAGTLGDFWVADPHSRAQSRTVHGHVDGGLSLAVWAAGGRPLHPHTPGVLT